MTSAPTRVAMLMTILIASGGHPAAGQETRPTGLARLRSNVERITRSVNAKWGVYVKCVETGEEVAINADDAMDTMSVIKIPLMVEAFRQVEEGKFALADRVTLQESDKRPGTGVIRSLDAGASLTIKDLRNCQEISWPNGSLGVL